MSACTFFGHRDSPESLRPALHSAILDLIQNHGVDHFYLGHNGAFDHMAKDILRQLAAEYHHIEYAVVLAYLPNRPGTSCSSAPDQTLFPEGMESVPRRFAICRRNKWMLEQADYVIAYVTHSWGGAAQFTQMAQRRGKMVIHLH